MELSDTSLKPIFLQVAEWVENEILKGNIRAGDKVYSQMEFAKAFNINPITAGKGVAVLEERGVLEKRRGLGMFVLPNAKERIYEYRKNQALIDLVRDTVAEAEKLGVARAELLALIEKYAEGLK